MATAPPSPRHPSGPSGPCRSRQRFRKRQHLLRVRYRIDRPNVPLLQRYSLQMGERPALSCLQGGPIQPSQRRARDGARGHETPLGLSHCKRSPASGRPSRRRQRAARAVMARNTGYWTVGRERASGRSKWRTCIHWRRLQGRT